MNPNTLNGVAVPKMGPSEISFGPLSDLTPEGSGTSLIIPKRWESQKDGKGTLIYSELQ